MNMISQLIFGGLLEGMVGFLPTCLVYVMSGIGGNVFSSACQFSGNTSVGASTSINGLLTGMLAVIVVNWSEFTGHP
jgi:membrane associated rhomboid family serine protease